MRANTGAERIRTASSGENPPGYRQIRTKAALDAHTGRRRTTLAVSIPHPSIEVQP
ncbi:hypothetical protein CBM2606_A40270 [Cupriavidus taiwanensis]|nr:hypothetical protein CBM2606_A40270 [Cupriavidus taiwanensis]